MRPLLAVWMNEVCFGRQMFTILIAICRRGLSYCTSECQQLYRQLIDPWPPYVASSYERQRTVIFHSDDFWRSGDRPSVD